LLALTMCKLWLQVFVIRDSRDFLGLCGSSQKKEKQYSVVKEQGQGSPLALPFLLLLSIHKGYGSVVDSTKKKWGQACYIAICDAR